MGCEAVFIGPILHGCREKRPVVHKRARGLVREWHRFSISFVVSTVFSIPCKWAIASYFSDESSIRK